MMCVLLWLCTTAAWDPRDQTLPIITPTMTILGWDIAFLLLTDASSQIRMTEWWNKSAYDDSVLSCIEFPFFCNGPFFRCSFILFLSDNEEILEISNVRNLAIRQFLAHSSSSDGWELPVLAQGVLIVSLILDQFPTWVLIALSFPFWGSVEWYCSLQVMSLKNSNARTWNPKVKFWWLIKMFLLLREFKDPVFYG
jgi:hypothetical protein